MQDLTCAEIAERDLVARYVAGRLADDVVERLESHYLTCARCYGDLRLAIAIRQTLPRAVPAAEPEPVRLTLEAGAGGGAASAGASDVLRRRIRRVGAAAALAAAAVVAIMVVDPGRVARTPTPVHRDELPAATSAPVPQAPLGDVPVANGLSWLPVAGADRYRVALYDDTGAVIWEAETTEPHVALPEDPSLEPGVTYLWDVAARVDWNRWVRSDPVPFQIREP